MTTYLNLCLGQDKVQTPGNRFAPLTRDVIDFEYGEN